MLALRTLRSWLSARLILLRRIQRCAPILEQE